MNTTIVTNPATRAAFYIIRGRSSLVAECGTCHATAANEEITGFYLRHNCQEVSA